MRRSLVSAPGARLYVEETDGGGSPLLLAHAATGSARHWRYQQEAFAAAGHRVLAWSRRGSAGTGVSGIDQTRDDISDIDRIADAFGLDRFHAIGTAAGGGVMLRYALARPDRVLTLVIANSTCDLDDDEFQRRLRALRPAPFADLPVEARELGPSYRAANPEGVKQWLAIAAPPSPPARTGDDGESSRPRIGWREVASLRMRSLWLTGDGDLYLPPPLLAEFRRHVADGEFYVMEDCGHSAYWEQRDAFNAIVLRFLERSAAP